MLNIPKIKGSNIGKILIIDNRTWILALLHRAFHHARYNVSVAPDAKDIVERITSERFDLVLLSLYLKHGYFVWEVLQDIKKSAPYLPVIILAAYDKYLYDPQLDLADGYVVRSWSAAEELRQQVDAILGDKFNGSKTPSREKNQMTDTHPCAPAS